MLRTRVIALAVLASVSQSQTQRLTRLSYATFWTNSDSCGPLRRGVTARHYIRRPDAALIAAADRVCSRISAALDGKTDESGKVFELRKA